MEHITQPYDEGSTIDIEAFQRLGEALMTSMGFNEKLFIFVIQIKTYQPMTTINDFHLTTYNLTYSDLQPLTQQEELIREDYRAFVGQRHNKPLMDKMRDVILSAVSNHNSHLEKLCGRCSYDNDAPLEPIMNMLEIPEQIITPLFHIVGSMCKKCGYIRSVSVVGMSCRSLYITYSL